LSEFVTGETIVALHPASQKNLPGAVELGFNVPDLDKFHQEMKAKGVQFSMPPTRQDFGGLLAQFVAREESPRPAHPDGRSSRLQSS
jgi:uncharacterized glyoxalase superfamily protein PhnB